MAAHPTTGFDLDEVDRLMTTTKQVRKRLDLSPAGAPRGAARVHRDRRPRADGRQPRTQPLDDHRRRATSRPASPSASPRSAGRTWRPTRAVRLDDRSQKVIESAEFLVDHLAEVPALVISLRLDRPPLDPSQQGGAAAYYGSVLPGVWSFQLAARARGIGSAWTTFHLEHEAEIAELLGIPDVGHAGVPARRRLLHRRHVHACAPPLRRRGHLPQPLEATRHLTYRVRPDPTRAMSERSTAARSLIARSAQVAAVRSRRSRRLRRRCRARSSR